MPKLNSYQKLKLENQKLKQDIFNLVRKENELDGITTKAIYSMMYDKHDAIVFGSRTTENNSSLYGIMSAMEQYGNQQYNKTLDDVSSISRKSYVGIICKNASDFNDYLKENNIKGKRQTTKILHAENKIYICFASVCDTCSWDIDNYYETKSAKDNKEYDTIRNIILSSLPLSERTLIAR